MGGIPNVLIHPCTVLVRSSYETPPYLYIYIIKRLIDNHNDNISK